MVDRSIGSPRYNGARKQQNGMHLTETHFSEDKRSSDHRVTYVAVHHNKLPQVAVHSSFQ